MLFDFDGTLADTVGLILATFAAVLPEPVPVDEVRSWIGHPLLPVFENRYPGRGEEFTARYKAWNAAHHDDLIRPVPGIAALLTELAACGVGVGVVSSKSTPMVRRGLSVLGLAERSGPVIGLEDCPRHKPDPAPLLLGARRLGVDPAQCRYVGDTSVDVEAARAAGMGSIAVTWGAAGRNTLLAAGPDALVSTVPELADHLGGSADQAGAR